MPDEKQITPEAHREQIRAYTKERPAYEAYARAIQAVLADACVVSFPDALVQSRAKTISSFAEKAARKFAKYPNAVEQMTDLCGARVIVQTTEQVAAVKQFIDANFKIVEEDDKADFELSVDAFGYRDMHYIVELRPNGDDTLNIASDERNRIGQRRAEIQVRTWVQHAWADTLHDRIYKNSLSISSDILRTGALLSALLEESDRTFRHLADELDGLIANYTAFATKEEVEQELGIQEMVLANEPDEANEPLLAMRLAKLALARGDDRRAVEVLQPYADIDGANRCELLSDLGFALCHLHRDAPSSEEYARGRSYLEQSLAICQREEVPFVPHLRKQESLHARALARLGWAFEVIPDKELETRQHFQQAHEHEPANPYYLANMLGAEMQVASRNDLPDAMRTTIRQAIETARDHAVAGIELPWAFFTAGRLNVLLKNGDDALGDYARGIRHCLAGTHCVSADALDHEMQWLKRLHDGEEIPPAAQHVIGLLDLGKGCPALAATSAAAKPRIKPPVLIIAGGAATIDAETLDKIKPLLRTCLGDFQGTVISGGTTAGVPGCVGDVAGELATQNRKQFELIGYIPNKDLPNGVFEHASYDKPLVRVGAEFSAEQILRNWSDILAAGIAPSDVMLLGIGGGPLSAVEYRIALGLGASVGIVMHTGGAAEELLDDKLWLQRPNTLYPLPRDATTLRAFVIPPRREFKEAVQTTMAQSFHKEYVAGSTGKLPPSMRPWQKLDDTFKTANCEQAKYSVAILEAAGFGVQKVEGKPIIDEDIFNDFTDSEVERMAELEHGRWNMERLRDGWRYGTPRDDANKIHNCIVSWQDLDDAIKPYDRSSVRAFPRILAQADLKVFRKDAEERG